jgi:hypothetical protein
MSARATVRRARSKRTAPNSLASRAAWPLRSANREEPLTELPQLVCNDAPGAAKAARAFYGHLTLACASARHRHEWKIDTATVRHILEKLRAQMRHVGM